MPHWNRIAAASHARAWLCAALAIAAGMAAASAADLYGVHTEGGLVHIRAITPAGVVRELGVMPATGEAGVRGLVTGGGGTLMAAEGGAAAGASALVMRGLGVPGQASASGDLILTAPEPGAYPASAVSLGGAGFAALFGQPADVPPFTLAYYDASGRPGVVDALRLPREGRFTQLARCPDGAIYASAIYPGGAPRLVRIDPIGSTVQNLAHFTVRGARLAAGIKGLACSPDGRLTVLADPDDGGRNAAWAVDGRSGALSLIGPFDVEAIAFMAPDR